MKKAVLVVAVLVIAVCATPLWSQGPGKGGPPPGARMAVPLPPPADMIEPISNTLGLTQDQAIALKAVLTANDEKILPLAQAGGEAAKAVHDAFAAADFDSTATLADAASEAQLAFTKAKIDGWKAIQASNILTADQFAKLLAGPGPGGPPRQEPGGGGISGQPRRR